MAFDIKFYLSIFWRRLPYFTVVAVLISAIGISVATVLPSIYISAASILVESEQIPGDLAASTVDVGPNEQIQIIEQRLMTRTNLLGLSQRLGLHADRPEMTASAIVNNIRGRTEFKQIQFGRGGSRRRPDSATAFTISFTAPTAAQAAEVTNELVTMVLQENVRLRTRRATDTLEFFQAEVDRLGGELDQVADQILAFKKANESALPDSLSFRRSEQARLQERLLQLEREETNLRESRARLLQIYERTGRVSATGTAPRSPEEEELRSLRQTLEQQLVLFSEANPKVKLLRNRITALEKVVADQVALTTASTTGEEVSDLDLQLEQIDGRLEYINEEQVRLEGNLNSVTDTILATPGNDLRLKALERRYANIQEQYNKAVGSLAQAATGERIEVLSKGERFSVFEQAVPPQRPDSPNRKLIALGAVAAGLVAGLAVVILLELLNRSIRRPVELTNRLGIQAFGTVPYMHTRRERLTKRAIIGSVLALFAGAVPAGVWALHAYYLPLDLLIRQTAQKLGIEPFISGFF